MAFLFPECEFCAYHGDPDFCDDCDSGDGFEPQDRVRQKRIAKPDLTLQNAKAKYPTARMISVINATALGGHPTNASTQGSL